MRIWLEPLLKMVFLLATLLAIAAYLAVLEKAWSGQLGKRWPPPWKRPRTVWDVLCCGWSLLMPAPPAGFGKNLSGRSLASIVVLAASFAAFATIPFGDSLPLGNEGPAAELVLVPEIPVGPLMFLAMNAVMAVGLMTIQAVGGRPHAFQPVWLLAFAGTLTLSGSLNLQTAINHQAASGLWWLGVHPFGLMLVLAASLEDPLLSALPAAKPGPIDGRLALARTFHLLATAFLITCLYLGGWHAWRLLPADPDSVSFGGGLLRCLFLVAKGVAVAVGLLALQRFRPTLHCWGVPTTVRPLLALGTLNLAAVACVRQFTTGPDWGLQTIVSWSLLLAVVGITAARSRRTAIA